MSLQLILLVFAPGAPPIRLAADTASAPHIRVSSGGIGGKTVLTMVNPRPAMMAASVDTVAAEPRLFCDLSAFNMTACVASGDDNCLLPVGTCLTADEIAQQGANASFVHASLVARWAERDDAGGRNVSLEAPLGAAAAHGLVQAVLAISHGCNGEVCTASASENPCGYVVASMSCPISLEVSVHPCATPGYAELTFKAPFVQTWKVTFPAEIALPALITFSATDAVKLAFPYVGTFSRLVKWVIPLDYATAKLIPLGSVTVAGGMLTTDIEVDIELALPADFCGVPSAWTCVKSLYKAGDGRCDCGCGYPDPDCTPSDAIYGCPAAGVLSPADWSCSATGTCAPSTCTSQAGCSSGTYFCKYCTFCSHNSCAACSTGCTPGLFGNAVGGSCANCPL
ncbi:hypothetical protein T492DRAFT_866224, partial [Pavlovales sp. CCMP2436]